MAVHKHTKKNINTLNTWLNNTKSARTAKHKKNQTVKSAVKKVTRDITPIAQDLNKEIKHFASDIKKDIAQTEKLINQFRKRADILMSHIDAELANAQHSPKSIVALRDLRKVLSSTFEKVNDASQKIIHLKIPPRIKNAPHQTIALPLTKNKKILKKNYRSHVNVFSIHPQKKKGT